MVSFIYKNFYIDSPNSRIDLKFGMNYVGFVKKIFVIVSLNIPNLG